MWNFPSYTSGELCKVRSMTKDLVLSLRLIAHFSLDVLFGLAGSPPPPPN